MGGVTEGAHDARPTPPGPSSLSQRARCSHPMMADKRAPWRWLSGDRLGTIIGGRAELLQINTVGGFTAQASALNPWPAVVAIALFCA